MTCVFIYFVLCSRRIAYVCEHYVCSHRIRRLTSFCQNWRYWQHNISWICETRLVIVSLEFPVLCVWNPLKCFQNYCSGGEILYSKCGWKKGSYSWSFEYESEGWWWVEISLNNKIKISHTESVLLWSRVERYSDFIRGKFLLLKKLIKMANWVVKLIHP